MVKKVDVPAPLVISSMVEGAGLGTCPAAMTAPGSPSQAGAGSAPGAVPQLTPPIDEVGTPVNTAHLVQGRESPAGTWVFVNQPGNGWTTP